MGLASATDEPALIEKFTIPCAYVIMDQAYGPNRSTIMEWLNQQNIWSVGRYGAWTYDSMEGALVQGKKLAEKLSKS